MYHVVFLFFASFLWGVWAFVFCVFIRISFWLSRFLIETGEKYKVRNFRMCGSCDGGMM